MSAEVPTDERSQACIVPASQCRTVFDLVSDGVCIHDVETGAILDANRRVEQMFGLSSDALRGTTFDMLSEGLPPYTKDDALAFVRRAAAGAPQLFEWRARRSSGEPFWIEVNLNAVRVDGDDRLLAVVRDVSHRKAAERALRESEDRSRRRADELHAALAETRRLDEERSLAVDVLERGDAVVVLDRDFRIALVNENLQRLFRCSREEVLGRNVWQAFPEGATPGARFRPVFERVMRDRVPESFDEHYRPLDAWMSVSVYPTLQGGIAVFVRDITEHRRAEEAVREHEAFANRILASSLNGIYVVEVERQTPVYVNPRYTQLTGYTLADLRALSAGHDLVEELFHPEDRGRLRAHVAAVARARDGEVLDLEYRFRARDGRWMTCFSRETPFARDPDGRVRQLIGTFVDVTELRRAEESARESEARYRTLFESMTEGFALLEVVFDAEGRPADVRFVDVNPACERITGVSSADLVGKLLGEVAPKEREFWVRAYGAVALTGAPAHIEHRSTALGRDYAVHAFSPRGGELAVLFVDITERKRIEQELRDADRRKNEFLGMLSHELRNPLAPIRNSLYLLTHAPAHSREAARARHILLRQSEHLTRLVEDLLDVTRISRGKISLHRERVEVRELIAGVCDDHRSLFDEAGVELATELPDEPIHVDGDPTRLSQIVGNLLQNAAKFTPAGGRVVLAARRAGDRLELRVRDTGVGIAPEDLDRMFEPFAQGDRGLARTVGGLGLGLPLVKGLVELHGGTVVAQSAGRGHGTEFVVTLPLAASPAREEAAPEPPRPRGGRLVLVVEDNADAGQSLADVLEFGGHRVRIAPDGRTAIALAQELKPDVVICDIGLPDMSGYDVARELRQHEELRGTRLIALSGYAQPEHRDRALETGFDAHLAKPAEIETLDALLAT